jgi:hypothetical protein
LTAAAGVLFIVLLNGALFAPGPPPRGSDTAAQLAAELADDRAAILGGMFAAGVAAICGIRFFSGVGSWIRRSAPEVDPALSSSAVAGGLFALGLVLVGMLVFYGAAYKVAAEGDLATVRALTDTGNATIEMSKFGTALFVAGTLAATRGRGLLPNWFSVFGFAAVAALIVSSIALFSESSFTEFGGGLDVVGAAPAVIWMLLLCVLLGRRGAR